MRSAILGLLCVSLLSGCYVSQRELAVQIPATVPAGTQIAVLKPADATFESDNFPGSGGVVAGKLTAALIPYYPGSSVVTTAAPGGYVVKPQLLHWEDRATEWSGKADRVKVSLPLYRDGKLVGSALVTANSSWWTLGGDQPEDLIDQPFAVYAAKLAGRPIKDSLVKVKE
ncbi:hypothetical protein DB345_17850 [Spartobacteria bacterium LR76]|nr:hypothetical protein DB345_17850 [Spartobacteria bacterium LR76]